MTGQIDSENADQRWPGDLATNGLDRMVNWLIVIFLGFAVPLVSLFRGHWLEYFLPAGLLFSFVHLLRHRVTWRDYIAAMPREVFLAVGAYIVLGLVAALRVFDHVEPYEQLRMVVAPFIVYFSFYGVMFFVMIRGTALSNRMIKGLMWGTLAAFVLLAIEPFTGIASEGIFPIAHGEKMFSLAHFNRTFLALAMFSWLAAPWLREKFGSGLIGVLPPLAIWLLNFTGESEAILLGLIPSIAVYLVALWRPRWMLNIVFAFTAILLLTAPVFYPIAFQLALNLPPDDQLGFLVRTEIWDAVALFISDAPIFGHGMQSTEHFSPLQIANLFFPDNHIYHPHNGFLQAWADMGLLGALAMAGILWSMWRALSHLDDSHLPHLLALFSFAVAAFVSTHNLWAGWWLGLLAMAVAYAIATSGTNARSFEDVSGSV